MLHWLQSYYDLLHSAVASLEDPPSLSPGGGAGGGDYVDTVVLVKDCESAQEWDRRGEGTSRGYTELPCELQRSGQVRLLHSSHSH